MTSSRFGGANSQVTDNIFRRMFGNASKKTIKLTRQCWSLKCGGTYTSHTSYEQKINGRKVELIVCDVCHEQKSYVTA
jgi:hypothetical protein